MTNIDKAAEVIAGGWGATDAADIAQALADAGLLAPVPHVITTVEEALALPDETVIRDANGCVFLRDHKAENFESKGDWWICGGDIPFDQVEVRLPATVLTPTPEPTVKPDRETVIQAIDGCIPDDLAGYRQRYTDCAADAILALATRKTEREVREETVRDAIALLDGSDPGWPRHPYSPMSCLADHTEELVRAKGASDD